MPFIKPFRGLRYNLKKVGSINSVATPPYDIISLEQQRAFYAKHPNNFIRVIYGKQLPGDNDSSNLYSRAKKTLDAWVAGGILSADREPSIYPYQKEYTLGGKKFSRWGIVTLVRLDRSAIYPHEETRTKPKQDRLKLLETLQASLSPLFGLIPDGNHAYEKLIRGWCAKQKPMLTARLEGVTHRVWAVSKPAEIARLKKFLSTKPLIIADGHHRCEAAFMYRDAMKAKQKRYSADDPSNFAMFYLSAAGEEDPGLLPTHRVLRKATPASLSALEQTLPKIARITTVSTDRELLDRLHRLRARGKVAVGFYRRKGPHWVLERKADKPGQLDVEWLHNDLLIPWLGLAGDKELIAFTQDPREAVAWVKNNKAAAVFFVQQPRLTEVYRRAKARQRMPRKTTYFHPKPLAGLVEYKFELPE